MITPEKALNMFKKSNPDLIVKTGCTYYNKKDKKKYYIFYAVHDENKVEYNDPFYAVDSASGKIGPFTPAEDQDAYIRALKTNPIKV